NDTEANKHGPVASRPGITLPEDLRESDGERRHADGNKRVSGPGRSFGASQMLSLEPPEPTNCGRHEDRCAKLKDSIEHKRRLTRRPPRRGTRHATSGILLRQMGSSASRSLPARCDPGRTRSGPLPAPL